MDPQLCAATDNGILGSVQKPNLRNSKYQNRENRPEKTPIQSPIAEALSTGLNLRWAFEPCSKEVLRTEDAHWEHALQQCVNKTEDPPPPTKTNRRRTSFAQEKRRVVKPRGVLRK